MCHRRRLLASCAHLGASEGLVAVTPAPSATGISQDHNDDEDEKHNAHGNGDSVVLLVGLARVNCSRRTNTMYALNNMVRRCPDVLKI